MAGDDTQIFAIRNDFTGGINTRNHGSRIGDNQATILLNVDIGTPGETKKRPGITLIEDIGDNVGIECFGFAPAGGTEEVIAVHGTKLEGWTGSGSFTEHKTDFSSATAYSLIKGGESGENDVLFIQNGTDNAFRMNQSHSFQDLGDTNTSPPITLVNLWYRNRWWTLENNKLSWSDAFSADYSGAFDRTNDYFNMPVGQERALIGIRDQGIIALGEDEIWGINPSTTPVGTDKPEKLLEYGCVANRTAIQVGDDIMYLARDGVRGLFRSQQDKLQSGRTEPLSYTLKDEFDSITWSSISKACAIYFDNKYFLALPVDSSTTNNEVWVYYPALQAWMVITGWNVAGWGKIRINGEEKLYAIDSTDGKVYQAWSGYDDNGTAINYQEEGRKENIGKPLILKNGGEVRVRALSSGDYDLTISISLDDGEYQTLGTMSLKGNSPTLPATLPFTLADDNIVEDVFSIDAYGPWRQLRIKIQHNATNVSDDIIIYERGVVTYEEEYQPGAR